MCIYMKYNEGKPPCCTHECNGCLWNDEDNDEVK